MERESDQDLLAVMNMMADSRLFTAMATLIKTAASELKAASN